MGEELNNPRFTFQVKTMGCKANIYDSLVLEQQLEELGGVKAPLNAAADLFILNSCTVTAEADKQSHKAIKEVRNLSDQTWTVVTGCYAQVGEAKLKTDPNINVIIGNDSKSRLHKIIAQRFGTPQYNPQALQVDRSDDALFWGQLPTHSGKTRAFLKIQEGCNDYCTYCIIPYARGQSRSISQNKIITEISRLVDNGVQEVILTGTNIADYGLEFQSSLEKLVEVILTSTKLPRLRLTSLDPTEITDSLLDLMREHRRLMPHFHVSLQSPVSRILRAMKRHYRQEDVIKCLEKIFHTNPDIFVGMDVIAGFPSETKEEHAEALHVLTGLPWTRLHVFPYSPREGTPAVKIPGLASHKERKERAQELMALSLKRHEQFVSRYLHQTIDGVLFEKPFTVGSAVYLSGHSPNYCRILIQTPDPETAEGLFNTTGSVRILNLNPQPAQDWTLEGILNPS